MRRKKARKRRLRRRRIRNGIAAAMVLILIVLCIILFFKSCSTQNRIVGTWDYDTNTVYQFDKDGKGALLLPNENYAFTYSIQENRLFIDFENENLTDHRYTFTVSGSKLTLTAEEPTNAVYVLKKK